MRNAFFAVVILCPLAACTSPDSGAARVRSSDDYVTGSNLPRRSSEVQVMSKEQAEDLQRRPGPVPTGMGR